jgi:hypothetical protein
MSGLRWGFFVVWEGVQDLPIYKEKKMFRRYIFNLSVVHTLARRGAMKSFFAAMLLPWLMMTSITTNPTASAINGNSGMHPSNLGQLTGTIENPPPRHGPGHDYGAIGDESDPPMSSPAISPFTYTVNGYTVVLLTHGPGHDFGVLGDEYKSAMNLGYSSPITYTVNGYTIVRRSELGPLTGTTDNSHLNRGPGHDYGVLGDEYRLP